MNARYVCARDALVVGVNRICREHVGLEFVLSGFPASHPGQFLQIRCSGEIDASFTALDWPRDEFPSLRSAGARHSVAFLRRPFSIADRWADDRGRTHLRIISRAVGRGTRWLEHVRRGQTLDITGPLGRGFGIPAEVPIVLVGGGVGIPPLLYLARRLHELGRGDVTAVFGATTRALLPLRLTDEPTTDGAARRCVQFPSDAPFPAIVTTDDGSLGLPGVVSDGLRRWFDGRTRVRGRASVLACGPGPMLRAVAELTRALDLDCQLCIERTMGCGLGTCLSCVVRVADAGAARGWRWALACRDGPVFDRDALLDYRGGQPS